jgi:hypothetical protein
MWKDLKTVVSARDASITDDTGSTIPAREFLEILDGADEGHECAAIRWAVALGGNERLVLQLQGLPTTAAPSMQAVNQKVLIMFWLIHKFTRVFYNDCKV